MISMLFYLVPIDVSLYQIKMETGCEVIVTSGYRDEKENKRAGGVKNSLHLQDRARDVVPKCDLTEWSKIACKYASVIQYDKHVHIDNRRNKICLVKY